MADLNNFDAREVEPASFDPLPAGKFEVVIVASELKPTKAGTGSYLELKFQVVQEGEHKGRLLWDRLNLHNPNETAVSIARGQLSSLCRAVGVLTPGDSQELHDLPLIVRVTQRTRADNGEITNEIKQFYPRPQVAVGAGAAENAKAPWERT